MSAFELVQVDGEKLTVSLIVWRRFKRPMPGLVEAVYAANPGLAALGHVLPVGAKFSLPIPEEKSEEQDTLEPITLW